MSSQTLKLNTVLMHPQNANYKWLASSLRKSRSKMVPHWIIRTFFAVHAGGVSKAFSKYDLSSNHLKPMPLQNIAKACHQLSKDLGTNSSEQQSQLYTALGTPINFKQYATTPGQNILTYPKTIKHIWISQTQDAWGRSQPTVSPFWSVRLHW